MIPNKEIETTPEKQFKLRKSYHLFRGGKGKGILRDNRAETDSTSQPSITSKMPKKLYGRSRGLDDAVCLGLIRRVRLSPHGESSRRNFPVVEINLPEHNA